MHLGSVGRPEVEVVGLHDSLLLGHVLLLRRVRGVVLDCVELVVGRF